MPLCKASPGAPSHAHGCHHKPGAEFAPVEVVPGTCGFNCLWGMQQVGASAVILGANYTLDSLMLKYQGVDWADHDNWNCNAGCAFLTARTPTSAGKECV